MAKPNIRFRIDFGPAESVGPGKVALLEHIDSSGSISQAARDLGMSYRRAWQLVEDLNASFREPVTAASAGGKHGGGATLTPLGHELVRAYRTFETDLQDHAARHFTSLARYARKNSSRARPAPIIRMSAR